MKNWLRGFDFHTFLGYLGVALIYPVYAWITSEQKMLKCMDAMTIVGLVFLILGVIRSLVRHGDFDISEYVIRRSIRRERMKPFGAFREDKEEERKERPNYPALTGLTLLLLSAVLSLTAY